MKRLIWSLVPLIALFAAAPAQAIEPAACAVQSTSRLDALINPVKGGDEGFFTTAAGPPNVSLVIDNSGSMTWWPIEFGKCSSGCDCKPLDDLGYDPTADYEPEWDNYNSGGASSRYTEWFNKSKVYQVSVGRDGTGLDEGKWPNDYGFGASSGLPGGGPNPPLQFSSVPFSTWSGLDRAAAINSACDPADPVLERRVTDPDRCKSCLATKGYYLENTSTNPAPADSTVAPTAAHTHYRNEDFLRRRMVGNFLNFFSPRYILARRTLKDVIADISKVRMNLVAFRDGSTTRVPVELRDFKPACNLSDPTSNTASFDSSRNVVSDELDELAFTGGTPLARTLFGAGYAYTNQDGNPNLYEVKFGNDWDDDIRVNASALEEAGTNNQKSVCVGCAFSAIILLTDGEPSDSYEDSIPVIGASTRELVWDDCVVAGQNKCRESDLDEVAQFLWTNDIRNDYARVQRVATYTIAFGLDPDSWAQTLLRHTAEVGGGQFYSAYNSSQLKTSILNIFNNILTRNTAFSSSTVSSLQTGSENLTAIMPRMSPRKDQPWRGSLYRFNLWNEFVKNQDHPQNGDGKLDDIFVVDTTGDIVVEDAEGTFKKQGTSQNAVEIWEAGAKLRQAGHAARRIYTVIDRNDDGVFTEADNPPIEFKKENVDTLINYLGIKGAPYCPTSLLSTDRGALLEKFNLTVAGAATVIGVTLPAAVPTSSELNRLCAQVLIEYIRGRDLGDEDSDNNRTETRASVLGDIFHSSPVLVTPPVDQFLCDLGLATQCVLTLYGGVGTTPTPLASYSNQTPNSCSTASTVERDAYDKWRFENQTRDRVILVGANDGMLHAFHDGEGGAPTCVNGQEVVNHVNSTGEEVWAFIPIDLLPRLHEHPFGHAYYVDGDPMVRDIWVDANEDGVKQHDEFRTLAVGAEGRGGVHYFALEVKFDSAGNVVTPEFRWTFPQPMSREAALFGKTLNGLSPKPPPIGPVLLSADTANGGFPATNPVVRNGVPTVERWVAMLSGGWSPGAEKGRGVYMVDAWYGDLSAYTGRKDNLLWKWDYSPAASGAQQASRSKMTFSIAAPVAMVDYGGTVAGTEAISFDGFFDTGVVGDLGGQLWVLRFFEPGARPAGGGLISNWAGGRGFEMDRDAATTSGTDEYGAAHVAKNVSKKWPFFYLASTTIQDDIGALRAFIGTGNRYSLLDQGMGKCRFDNPLACAKSDCDNVKVVYQVNRLDHNVSRAETHWKDVTFAHGKLDVTAASNTACGSVGTTTVTAEIAAHEISSCDGGSPGLVRQTRVTCGQRAADEFVCQKDATRPAENYGDLVVAPDSTTLATLGKNRYFGIWLYGGIPNRKFTESQTTTGLTSPEAFDGRRLTDRTAANPSGGNLVDVTGVQCPSNGGACTCAAGSGEVCFGKDRASATANAGFTPQNGMGWMVAYTDLERKTASGSSVLASCVLWNDISPGLATTACDPNGAPNGRFYQAHFLTGAPNCAAGFIKDGQYARYIQRDGLIAPPPEPAMAVQINRDTREVRYSSLLIESGQGEGVTAVTVGDDSEQLRMVYELPISRQLHDCRHDANGCVTISP